MTTLTISSVIIGISGLMMLAFGTIYCLNSGYMYYHEAALQTAWKDVPAGYQGIILGLMRSTGGGLISGAIVLGILQYQFYHAPQFWIAMTILIGGSILSFGAFHAMILFKNISNGNPPMLFATVSTVLFVIANLLNFITIYQK